MSSSLGRNSLIMASGTAASRVTGQIRTILLAAALGTTGLAANAYQAGSMIPQALFTLVSGGIFNAVLVPQIVRALEQEDAEDRLNKLITLAVSLLAGVTLLMAVATPLLTRLYVSADDPDLTALTNAFTLWCMPQIFFYGLYTVIGQILAAKDRFGMYAWSSVGANVISCAGFTMFLVLFGRASEQPLDFWTADRLLLTAGTWTLGVAFQALILFVPLTRCGIRYRPKFGVDGIGLRSMGAVAGWSLGIVVIDQLANIVTTRIATSAPARAEALLGLPKVDVAGNATYQNAFTLYMLPYSLIAVSVATALFPRISRAIADGRIGEAREALSASLRNVGVLMMFFSVAFVVMPTPIILALLPSVSVHEAALIAAPLTLLGLGLPITSMYLIIQRTFYAFEDGRTPFLFMVLFNAIFVVMILAGEATLMPTTWVTLIGLAASLGHLVAFPFLIPPLRRRFDGSFDGRRIAGSLARALVAAVVAAIGGLLMRVPAYALVGADLVPAGALDRPDDGRTAAGGFPSVGPDAAMMNWPQAIGVCVILTIVITVLYVSALWVLRSRELMDVVAMVSSRLGRRTPAAEGAAADAVPSTSASSSETASATPDDAATDDDATIAMPVRTAAEAAASAADTVPVAPNDPDATIMLDAIPAVGQAAARPAVTASQPPFHPSTEEVPSTTPTVRMSPESSQQSLHYGVRMKPRLGDTIINRYTLVSPLREEPGLQAWRASDRVLTRDCQLFLVTDRKAIPAVNAVASTVSLMADRRFTPVLGLHQAEDVLVLVTAEDAGLSLTDYLQGRTGRVLSYEAIRAIVGETLDAVQLLLARGVEHPALGTDTIRVSAAGIQIADLPVASMLAPVALDASSRAGTGETRSIRQLSALLYALLTHTPSRTGDDASYDIAALPADTPEEFRLICRRGLGLAATPMSSLAEVDALLGAWTPLNKLNERDIALPSVAGRGSVAAVTLLPTDPQDVIDVPASIVNSTPMPSLALATPRFSSALDSEDVMDVTPLKGDLFSGFNDTQATSSINRSTLGLDVSQVRHDEGAATTASPRGDAGMYVASAASPAAGAYAAADGMATSVIPTGATGAAGTAGAAATPSSAPADDQGAGERTQVIPPIQPGQMPSFAPDATGAKAAGADVKTPYVVRAYRNEEEDFSDQTLFANLPTKIITVIVGLLVVVAAGFGAVYALNLSTAPNIGGADASDPWSTENLDDVPFGASDNASASKDDDKDKQDDAAKDDQTDDQSKDDDKDKDENYENNTPLTITSQDFVENPGGQSGYAYHLHLDQKQKVYRLSITIRSSGGHGYLRTDTTGDPTQGTQVADFTFDESGTTEVKFDKVTETQDVIVWVPLDSLPGNQFYIDKVQLF
ncbi:murein biosynthesis integral membrane protein MurJ [Bifidobacterium samirii]|uniref:MviN-like protein n=1 Tax=Bifidobacterium samirii TaxID=2306974 RepID=A0A430FVD7_9BIFI|nr:murein biosynthesis integral membrane protein MurJ [Bifidobacterium samirii]RSX57452.1 MviN-like protein [Bifidobacterium samirii]